MSRSAQDSPWISRSGREAFSETGRPVWMSGSGREAHPHVRDLTGGPPGCPGVIGRSSRMSGSGRDALPNVRQ